MITLTKKPSRLELDKYNAFVATDTVFMAHARLAQSKWRDKKGYPAGKYGNYLKDEFSKDNYLTQRIAKRVELEIQNISQTGALISQPRIWNNLLSSQPLAFNLFAELDENLDLASKLFHSLFPDRIDEVTNIDFEYSPSRGNLEFTGDHSAFDVFIRYKKNGTEGFAGIEVKYSESLGEESAKTAEKNYKQRYIEISLQSGLFRPERLDNLKKPPLAQIWRDHLLSIAMQNKGMTGFFIFLFPEQNTPCQKGIDLYLTHLKVDNPAITGFYSLHLEKVLDLLVNLTDANWVKEFKDRYCF